MPPALIAAAATIGGAVITSNANKKAASTAANAQADASASQKALQDQAIGVANQVNAPFLNTGYAALDALAQRYGLTGGGTGGGAAGGVPGVPGSYAYTDGAGAGRGYSGGYSGTSAPTTTANPYAQYLADNPDIAAEAARVVGSDPRFPTLQSYLQWHDQQFSGESRPSYAVQATGTPEASTQQGDTFSPPNLGLPAEPNYQTASLALTSPGKNPFGATPELSQTAFEASPYYQLGLKTGQDNLNANFAASGLLKSGAAIKGAIKFGQENNNLNYGNWADRQTDIWKTNLGQWNTDRAASLNQLNNQNRFDFNRYTDARNYLTDLYNTQTNNLFSLANYGQNAGTNITNAASGYASKVGGIYQNNADAAAAQANANAAGTAYLGNTIAGQVANLFNNGVKTTGGYTPVIYQSSNGWANPGNIFATSGAF